MFDEAFINRDYGVGSALAVLLFIAVLPLMIVNVRRNRQGARHDRAKRGQTAQWPPCATQWRCCHRRARRVRP